MDMVVKKSTDDGQTWTDLKPVYSTACTNRDHGTPVYDAVRDRVVTVFCGDEGLTWTTHSDDDGETWSTPQPVPLGQFNTSRSSPGTGLQLRTDNPYAPGRLLWVAQLKASGDSADIVYFSDDGGITFSMSEPVLALGNEAQMVELSNGSVLLNARLEADGLKDYRLFVRSDDGGKTFLNSSRQIRRDPAMQGTQCFGSFISVQDSNDVQCLLYSHPSDLNTRDFGKVWLSSDQAQTFKPVVDFGASSFAYSCLTPMHSKLTVGLAYETNATDCTGPSCQILFTTFTPFTK